MERALAICIGMWLRGEVGVSVLIISLGYGICGQIVTVAALSLALNLLLSLVKAERAAVPVGLMNCLHLMLLPAEQDIDITLRPYGLQKLHELGNGDA